MAKSDADVRRNGRFGYWTLAGFYFFFGVLTLLLHRGEATLKMDRLIYDNWVRFGQSAPPSKYVVVGIDSDSVEAKGRWPWPRNDQAQIIDNLTDAGAAIILIDILYSEASAIIRNMIWRWRSPFNGQIESFFQSTLKDETTK